MSVRADDTRVFPRLIDLEYPVVERAKGVRLHLADGREVLDACSGGAMVACLGHGVRDAIDAAARQAEDITYVYNHHFTNAPQERYAARLLEATAPGMARVRLTSGGSEANETSLRLARQYHVDRGEEQRWRVISPAQAYHGATMGTLALSGRRGLQSPYEEYLPAHLHLPPSTWRFDATGEQALAELDALLERAGDTVAAFVCEPVSAAALPAYSPPEAFWHGLAERRERHGFLVVFDEIVTGMGRTGTWWAADQLPIEPDIITAGKGMGAAYAPLAGTLCSERVHEALAHGSKLFDHGHTWDGAPLSCAVGLAVLDHLQRHKLVERVREHGPRLHALLGDAVGNRDIVAEVRGRGFLLGVGLVDPRDGESLLPDELGAASLVDDLALEHGVLVTSTHSNRDGLAGDETLLAPAFTTTDEELEEMVERFRLALCAAEDRIKDRLSRPVPAGRGGA